MLPWWFDDKRDEVRSYEPATPIPVPHMEMRAQMALRWQPPAPVLGYREWSDEQIGIYHGLLSNEIPFSCTCSGNTALLGEFYAALNGNLS